MPVLVHTKLELARGKLLSALLRKQIKDGTPVCPECKGSFQQPYNAHIPSTRICKGCKGLGIDLDVLPDKGKRYHYFGYKADDVTEEFVAQHWGDVYHYICRRTTNLGSHRVRWGVDRAHEETEGWAYIIECTPDDHMTLWKLFPFGKITVAGRCVRVAVIETLKSSLGA